MNYAWEGCYCLFTIVLMIWYVGLWIAINEDLEIVIHRGSFTIGALRYSIAGSPHFEGQKKDEKYSSQHIFSILGIPIRTRPELNDNWLKID